MAMRSPTRDTRPSSVPWVIALAVLVVGLAGWIVYDTFFVEDAAPTPEARSLVEDFVTSLDEYDVDSANALVMPDFATNVAASVTGPAGAIDFLRAHDLRVAIVGPMVSQADGAWTVVAVPLSFHDPALPADEGVPLMATVVVYERNVEGHLISALWVERPSTVSPRVG